MLALVFLSTQVCIVAVRGYAVLFARCEMFICLKRVTAALGGLAVACCL